MQWFPWSWFSSMQFIGAGGFSAVYSTTISQPYDLEPLRIAVKIVDDKILNEVCPTYSTYFMLSIPPPPHWLEMLMSNDGKLDLRPVEGLFTTPLPRPDCM